jgi:hypothetical protein
MILFILDLYNNSNLLEDNFRFNIHNFLSIIKESLSWLIVIKKRFAILENVFTHMLCSKSMLNRKKNIKKCIYQFYLSINDDEDKIWNIQFLIQFKNLFKNSLIEIWTFRRYESEDNIKSRIQNDDFRNDTKKHDIFIRFVHAVNNQYFQFKDVILWQIVFAKKSFFNDLLIKTCFINQCFQTKSSCKKTCVRVRLLKISCLIFRLWL